MRIIVEKVISRLADAELIKKYRNLSQVETENLSELNELDVFSEEIIKLMKHHILTIFKSIDKTNLGEMNFSIDLISAWVKTAVIEMQKDIDVDTIIKNTSSLVYDSSHADCLINSVRKDREVKEIDGQLYVPIDVVHDALNESARQLLTITREIRKIDKNDAKIAAEKLRAIRDEAQKVVFASSMQNSLEKVRRAIDSATAFLDEIS